jgi:biopolymer transport protein ExbB
VGEALIMTAIGLLVAVPAVLAYNWLQSRNRRIAELLSGFSTDLLAYITSKGAVKPEVMTKTSTQQAGKAATTAPAGTKPVTAPAAARPVTPGATTATTTTTTPKP